MSAQSDPLYRVSSDAVFETFEDEVVIINMVSGSYFALDVMARAIWTLVENNGTRSSIIRAIQSRYEGNPGEIARAIEVLLDDLEREGLIVSVLNDDNPTPALVAEQDLDNAPRAPFQTPVVSKFTDMQDLLLLDPIHEVDEHGWPHAKAAPLEPPQDVRA